MSKSVPPGALESGAQALSGIGGFLSNAPHLTGDPSSIYTALSDGHNSAMNTLADMMGTSIGEASGGPGQVKAAPMVQQLNPAYVAWERNQSTPAAAPTYSGISAASLGDSLAFSPIPGLSGAYPAMTADPMAGYSAVPAVKAAPAPPRYISVPAGASSIAAAPSPSTAAAPAISPSMTLVQQLQAYGMSPSQAYDAASGNPVLTINSGNFPSAGNNNASARAQMTPGGSLSSTNSNGF
jgi:hypothetical protein